MLNYIEFQPHLSQLKGKTIRKIYWDTTNVLKIYFTDGSSFELWAETEMLQGTDFPSLFVDKLNLVKVKQLETKHEPNES